MEITIFKEITTEGVIVSIEENSKKYHEGFYADMNNAPERKLVKESSSDIKGIIKELEAARIKINKDNTTKTNNECKLIVDRLEAANAPFTILEDDYKAERKLILDAEKARKQAIEDQVKFEGDHEFALLLNKTFEYDREQELKAKSDHDQKIADEAAIKAIDQQQKLSEAKERDKINAENARLANTEHVRAVNRAILDVLEENDIGTLIAKKVVTLAAKGLLPNLTINY